MIIGIDIDDTITDTLPSINKYLRLFNPNKELDFWTMPQDERDAFCKKYVLDIHRDAKVKDHAKETIDYLHNLGYQIYLVTARGCDYEEEKANTIKYLNENKIYYDKIIFTAWADKTEFCRENNIKILIDDRKENLVSLAKYNIKGFYFSPDDIDENFECFANWLQIKNYFEKKGPVNLKEE